MEVIWGQEPEYQKRMRARWTKVADGTQQTWKKYRGAWIALIRELFSPSEVDGAVKRFRQLLASQRLKDLGWSEGR